jgi:glycine cleavage system aminomethyltransferase T
MTDEKLQILNPDLTIKTRKTLREPIGFVTRGGFSQALGTGIAICALEEPIVGEICLFRKPSSLEYHLCKMIKMM